MSDKFLYQNARVKSMEKTLFTSQSVSRLLDCSDTTSVFRALSDMNFGVGAKDGDFDEMFALEEQRAVEFLKEFNVDGALNAFLAQYDFHNLKAVYKSTLTGKTPVLAPIGNYDADTLKSWIEQDSSDIPAPFENVIKTLKSGMTSPRAIDCAVDKAMYAYIFSSNKRKSAIAKYFVQKVDLLNISTFLRCKKLGIGRKDFEEYFIEGGELDFLPNVYDGTLDMLKEKCRYTPYKKEVEKVVDDGNLVAYERALDNTLFKIWKDRKDELFEVSPIIAFYFAKITQIRIAKLVVAGIKNGVEPDRIKERMRELYA